MVRCVLCQEWSILPQAAGNDRLLLSAMLREVRLSLDPWLECAAGIGPLIDPNLHSCGTVRPHGAAELAHPETGFFIAGMKGV